MLGTTRFSLTVHHLVIGHIALPMGGQVNLNQLEFGHGPLLLSIVNGLHGDEYNGLGACLRLAQFLAQVEAGKTPYRLLGRIRILPAVNALALVAGTRLWPVDHSDINRLFPGYVAGEVGQRLAHLIYEAVRPSTICVDIHSGGAMAEWPQVRSHTDEMRVVKACSAMGLPLAWIRSTAQVSQGQSLEVASINQGTLGLTLQQTGVDSLVLSAGRVNQLEMPLAEQLCESLVRLAQFLGIVQGPRPQSRRVQEVQTVNSLLTTQAGLWLPTVTLGQTVRRQQQLGEVVDPLTGVILQVINTTQAGLVMSLRSQPLVNSGSLVCRVAVS